MEIITRLRGPEFGYVSTSIILGQCALVVLKQRENLPKGGVYTHGIVFGPTDLREWLQENGISFDIISKSGISSWNWNDLVVCSSYCSIKNDN